MLQLLQSHLTNHKQFVKIHNYKSKEITVKSGALQGSYLLYIIYVNDCKLVIKHSKILLYIDDMKIYKEIKNNDDFILLNEYLNEICEWNKKNGLDFNESKCKVIIFSKNEYEEENKFAFKINTKNIEYSNKIKDLGIIFDKNLDFEDHINFIISNSLKSIWLIKHYGKNFHKKESLIILYNSLVKSKLMFGSTIWSPNTQKVSEKIEKVQHKFLRFMSFKINKPMDYTDHEYSEIAKELNINTLESNRIYHDLILMYKIINNLTNLYFIKELLKVFFNDRNLRVKETIFVIPYKYKDINVKSTVYRMILTANNNNKDIDFFKDNFNQFKLKLDNKIKKY